MTHCVTVNEPIQVRRERVGRDLVEIREKPDYVCEGLLGIGGGGVNLDAVAGGEDDRLIAGHPVSHLDERARHGLIVKGEFLAHFYRSGLVI
jgi:hypothetical protein